jgi:hypothetical protein
MLRSWEPLEQVAQEKRSDFEAERVGGGAAVSFSDEERAELIAALTKTAEMVGVLLDALDMLLVAYVAGQQPTAGDVERLIEHSALWRTQLEKLRSRLSSMTIEPPRRGAMSRALSNAGMSYLGAEPYAWMARAPSPGCHPWRRWRNRAFPRPRSLSDPAA